jgi:glycosyltransferase 2 family protein
MKKILLRTIIAVLIVVVIFYFLVTAVDMNTLIQLLRGFSWVKLIILCFLSVLISILKSWRFLLLLRHNDIKVDFWDNLKVYIASQTTSPLPGGESVRGVLINKETGTSILRISGSVITQAYLEFLSAAMIVIIGSLLLQSFRIPALITLISISLLTFFLMHKRIPQVLKLISRYFKRMSFLHEKIGLVQTGFKKNVVSKRKKRIEAVFWWSLVIGILTNIIGGIIIYLITLEYQDGVSIMQSIFVYASSIVLQTLSIVSPGGIGVTEGGMVGVLLSFKVNLENSLAIVVIFRAVTLFFSVCLGLLFLSYFYGRRLLVK